MSMNVGGRNMLGGNLAPGSKKDLAAQKAFQGISDVLNSVRPTARAIAEKIDIYINSIREGSGKSFGRPMSPENKVKIESFLKELLHRNLGGNHATFPKMKLFQEALQSLSEKNSKYAEFGLTEIDCLIPPQNKLFLESHEILSHSKSLASAALSSNTRSSQAIDASQNRERQHADQWLNGLEKSVRTKTDEEVLAGRLARLNDSSKTVKTADGEKRRQLALGATNFIFELRQEQEQNLRSNSTRAAMNAYHDYTTYREGNRGRMEEIVKDPAYRSMSPEMQRHLFRLNSELDVLNKQL